MRRIGETEQRVLFVRNDSSLRNRQPRLGAVLGATKGARDTGLKAIGRVRSGSHFSIFYETKTDLLDILVPFFKTGLSQNEYCLWVVAPFEFLSFEEAKEALANALPELDRYITDKRMEIVSYASAFGGNDNLEPAKAVERFRRKLDAAKRRGLSSMRANGSSAWVREHCGPTVFRDYESEIDALLAGREMIVACTCPLTSSRADQILEVARTHDFAVTVRKGVWRRVQISDIETARREELHRSPQLEELTSRQREILQRIAEGQNTKQIAAVLGISVKTVEAHRMRLMRKLAIFDVPGLVRFAIRSDLVSAAA